MIGFHGKNYSLQTQTVKLKIDTYEHFSCKVIDEGAVVTFPIVFKNIPEVIISYPMASSASPKSEKPTWMVTNVSTTGCMIELPAAQVSQTAFQHELNLPEGIDFEIVVAAFERS